MSEVYDDRYNKSESSIRYIKQRVSDVAPTLDSDDTSEKRFKRVKPALMTSIVAGGLAGVFVDISLYPLDTFKTRLQSQEGFRASGGFKGVYKGILPVLLGSAPISALFFATYNTLINSLRTDNSSLNPFVYLAAASGAEVVCATVRVPMEIVKQRKQISTKSNMYIIKKTLRKEGIFGFYRGFWSTLAREIPFAAIQYPLWEYMIQQFIIYQNGQELTALQAAYCGAFAGAVAAMLTTPMDVIKTRIMLAEKEKLEKFKPYVNFNFAKEIYFDRGIFGFFAGVVPRVLWITLGGFIYFGVYERAKIFCEQRWCILKTSIQKVHELSPSYIEEKIESFSFWSEGFCPEEKKKDEEFDVLSKGQEIIDSTLLNPSNDKTREE